MLRKGIIEPNLFALSRMAVLEDFDLIGCRNLFPLSNMLILANLSGLGAFLATETKKEQSFFSRFIGNNSENRVVSVQ